MFLSPEKENRIRVWAEDVAEKMERDARKPQPSKSTMIAGSPSTLTQASSQTQTQSQSHTILAPTPVRLASNPNLLSNATNPALALALAPIREARLAPSRPAYDPALGLGMTAGTGMRSVIAEKRPKLQLQTQTQAQHKHPSQIQNQMHWQDAEREPDPVAQRLVDRGQNFKDNFLSMTDSPICGKNNVDEEAMDEEAEVEAALPVPPNTAVDEDNAEKEMEDAASFAAVATAETKRAPRRAFELERTQFNLKDEKEPLQTTESATETDALLLKASSAETKNLNAKKDQQERLVASIQYYDRVKQMLMYWNTYRNSTTGEMRQTRTTN